MEYGRIQDSPLQRVFGRARRGEPRVHPIFLDSLLCARPLTINEAVEDVFRSFGISDMSAILENEAIMLLLTKEFRYRAEYNQFKKKYNSEFEDFKTQVEISGKEDFAVEDDLMDWEFASNALKMIEEKKRILGV